MEKREFINKLENVFVGDIKAFYEILQAYTNMQYKIDRAINYTKRHFKEIVADEEAQELISILQGEEVKDNEC